MTVNVRVMTGFWSSVRFRLLDADTVCESDFRGNATPSVRELLIWRIPGALPERPHAVKLLKLSAQMVEPRDTDSKLEKLFRPFTCSTVFCWSVPRRKIVGMTKVRARIISIG